MKRTLALCALLAAADQAVKALIRTHPVGSVIFSAPPFFEITHRTNTGAAFSLLAGSPLAVTALSLVLLLALCAAAFRFLRPTRPARAAIACVLGGGVGNLADRLLFGEVTDYIRVLPLRFPVFNLADMCITGGVAVLILLTLTGRLEKPEIQEKPANGEEA